MKFKLNPLTGEFDYTSESANKQKLNPLTGEFNLVEGDGPFSQIFNPLTGNFNLGIAAAVKILTAVMSVQFNDGKENGLKALIAHGGIAQAVGATPDSPQSIKCNNGTIKIKDDELPIGYKRLKDIIFDGDCHYETNVYLTGADTIRFTINASEAGRNVLGCYTGSGDGDNFSFYLATVSAGSYVRYKDSLYRPKYNSNKLGVDVSLEITPTGTIGFDTNVSWTQQTFTCPDNLYIGWLPNATSPKFLGSFKGEIVVDNRTKFIPCERVSDNAIGYYDTYSNTFYENQGTGTATTSGYDYSHSTTVYADGAVETIVNSLTTLDGQGTFVSPNPSSTNRGYKKLGAMTEGHLTLTISGGWEFIVQGKNGGTGGNVSGWVNTFDSDVSGYTEYGIAVRKVGDVSYQYTNFNGIITFGGATAASLLKVGDVYDEHEILSGHIKRKIGVVVLTGAETWEIATATQLKQLYSRDFQGVIQNNVSLYSTIAPYGCTVSNRKEYQFGCYSGNNGNLCFQLQGSSTINTLQDWKDYLAAQYANGTPVIVAYPMVTPVTEDYGLEQEMIIGDGVNDINISQSELEDLELTVKYLSNNNS